ncbi:phospholipase [Adhaeribacter swui]|uniref:Phospholipase n=1 Tax=Adhaeribacter swui TaxID=2086471 RepID=A0A7G7G9W8_9BACT|nr:alpha/beta hydrolase-fold protein [Adhaeribacter swui]QNF33952.1 phospholipase [Adhaeribacter swui]
MVACTVKNANRKEGTNTVSYHHQYNTGRLTARPNNTLNKDFFITGVRPLQLDSQKDGFVLVPKSYKPDRPAAVAVILHGADGDAAQGLSLLRKYAEENNMILIAPAARAATWDIVQQNRFGADAIFLDEALTLAFERYNIDTTHVAIGGFSDGASYALSLGLANGDLFTHILAFSPGFVHAPEQNGKPAVYISHGIQDQILLIDSCSRRIVPQLQSQGLIVNYREFEGGHEIPDSVVAASIKWFLDSSLSKR